MLSANVLACVIILGLFIILGITIFFIVSSNKNDIVQPTNYTPPNYTPPNITNNSIISDSNDMNYVTAIDSHLEDFGMYEGALSNWYANHTPSTPIQACNSSVNNYTRKSRDIRNVSSVNTAMPFTSGEYMLYDESSRFQTPALHFTTANFNVDNYLRSNKD